MASTFPFNDWQTFRDAQAIKRLLSPLQWLVAITDWPQVTDWQTAAQQLNVWELIGRYLIFTHEDKLGQRAKRKRKAMARDQTDRAMGRVSSRTYESAIMEKSEIPFRSSDLHDFFNAIIWLNFPRAKFALHQRAFAIQTMWSQLYDQGRRCPLADRLTCFDEGGIILDLPQGLGRGQVEPLIQGRDDDAKHSFYQLYAGSFTLFGHGVMEVLMKRPGAIHASCIILDPGPGSVDERLSKYLDAFDDQTPDHGAINISWLFAAKKTTSPADEVG
ncbi:MAG: DUF3025 domain-containing protein [Chitinophagaceae bacterium]|nr:DUF3025 domain-containing protein [Oligoflexus sp.]